MLEWWLLPEDELIRGSPAYLARQQDYVETFYKHSDGNHVLLDVKRLCGSIDTTPEGRIALIQLYNTIRQRAGGNSGTELAMIEAEGSAIEFEQIEEGEQ